MRIDAPEIGAHQASGDYCRIVLRNVVDGEQSPREVARVAVRDIQPFGLALFHSPSLIERIYYGRARLRDIALPHIKTAPSGAFYRCTASINRRAGAPVRCRATLLRRGLSRLVRVAAAVAAGPKAPSRAPDAPSLSGRRCRH